MKEIAPLLEELYGKFILRDVFAKIVPGLLFIVIISSSMSTFQQTFLFINNLSIHLFILLLGVSWVIGFSTQCFLDVIIRILGNYTQNTTIYDIQSPNISINYKDKLLKLMTDILVKILYSLTLHDIYLQSYSNFELRRELYNRGNPRDILQFERFVIIKEACGNVASSLFLGILLYIPFSLTIFILSSLGVYELITNFIISIMLLITAITIILLLIAEHTKTAKNRDNWIKIITKNFDLHR